MGMDWIRGSCCKYIHLCIKVCVCLYMHVRICEYTCMYFLVAYPNGKRNRVTQVVMTQLAPFLTLLVY